MYLVSELASTVTAYEVTCGCGGLGVKEVFVTNTHGGNGTLPGNYTAAEIHLSVRTSTFPSLLRCVTTLLYSRHADVQCP